MLSIIVLSTQPTPTAKRLLHNDFIQRFSFFSPDSFLRVVYLLIETNGVANNRGRDYIPEQASGQPHPDQLSVATRCIVFFVFAAWLLPCGLWRFKLMPPSLPARSSLKMSMDVFPGRLCLQQQTAPLCFIAALHEPLHSFPINLPATVQKEHESILQSAVGNELPYSVLQSVTSSACGGSL